MKKLYCLLFMAGSFCCCFAFTHSASSSSTSFADSLAEERNAYVHAILDSLKDKANGQADSIFSNIRLFRGAEALRVRHFLAVMDYWGEALGVSCTYCHDPKNWALETKDQKQVARDMYLMRQTINRDILARMAHLKIQPARVNCGTCHHGTPLPHE